MDAAPAQGLDDVILGRVVSAQICATAREQCKGGLRRPSTQHLRVLRSCRGRPATALSLGAGLLQATRRPALSPASSSCRRLVTQRCHGRHLVAGVLSSRAATGRRLVTGILESRPSLAAVLPRVSFHH